MRQKSEEGVWETVKVIIQALLIAFFVRTFFYQPFNIPSESMYPTLKVGDYLFVSKLSMAQQVFLNSRSAVLAPRGSPAAPLIFRAVGFGRHAQAWRRAVFKLPTDTNIDYIKRVIGLPGDRIQMRDGVLFIKGKW